MLLAQTFNAHNHLIASLEINRRLHAHADARRRSGRDHISRIKLHELRNIGDNMRRAEHHRLCVAVLHAFAIEIEIHVQILHILNLIGCHEPWADRAEGWRTFALHPLATALRLKRAF